MPITHDVTAARAERPLYAALYATLGALAEPRIRNHLREVTAANGARLLSAQVDSLRNFLLEGDADEEDAPERDRLVASLDRAVARDGPLEAPEVSLDDSSRALADQAARSLAGAWLRHLRLTSHDGHVAAGALLPAPGPDEPDAGWSQICDSVAPYGLGAPDAEAILRGLLAQWQEGGAADIALPQRLTLARRDVERALQGDAGTLAPVGRPRTWRPDRDWSILQTIRDAISGLR